MMRQLIAGNWKMNGVSDALDEIDTIVAASSDKSLPADVIICPPATLISRAAERAAGSALAIGAQDCHPEQSGAHTGDLSAEMLADAGGCAVIVGHSERRTDHGESDQDVNAKAKAVVRAGLVAIICVGERETERGKGEAEAVVARQLAGSIPDMNATQLVVAYEPVWAIGTGRTPSEADIAATHAHIRKRLVERFGDAGRNVRILYGGSMKPANAAPVLSLPDVDGGLVGGASLKASDFLAIAQAATAR